jgi:hypothetical protein
MTPQHVDPQPAALIVQHVAMTTECVSVLPILQLPTAKPQCIPLAAASTVRLPMPTCCGTVTEECNNPHCNPAKYMCVDGCSNYKVGGVSVCACGFGCRYDQTSRYCIRKF